LNEDRWQKYKVNGTFFEILRQKRPMVGTQSRFLLSTAHSIDQLHTGDAMEEQAQQLEAMEDQAKQSRYNAYMRFRFFLEA